MANLIKKVLERKILFGTIALVIIASGYFGYTKIFSTDIVARHVTTQVQKGILIVSITGSGQTSVSNQVDVKPKASGDIIYVGVKNGQEVTAGMLLAQIDSRDAQKTVRDAEVNLESAKLSLEKLQKPADELSILQAENSLAQAKESKQKAEDDLKKAYEDGFNTVSNAFLDLPGVMTGLDDIFFDEGDFERHQGNIYWYSNQIGLDNQDKVFRYRDDVFTAYNKAGTAYTKNFDEYKDASRVSDTQTIDSLILETYETTKIIADTVKTSNNYIDFVQDYMEKYDRTIPSLVSTHQSNLDSYTSKTNVHLLNLFSIKRTIQTSEETIVNSNRTIAEKTESFVKLKAGVEALDIQSQELTIRQRENALLDAKEKLTDYFIRAPFGGVVAKINVKKGDPVSGSTVAAILITKQKIAEISLNEIDVAKVKTGQKATLTFDAIPDLTITGQVAEVDAVGTVSQGVVTYIIKIGFDTQDDRVKTAMSVSAAIVTEAKPNALLVPNSAVKSQGGMSYVEIVEGEDRNTALSANSSGIILKNPTRRQSVEIGASSDEFTEIAGGLKDGDLVVTRTIQPTTGQQQTRQQQGGLRIPGLPGGGGGGGFRGGGGGAPAPVIH